MSSIIPAIYEHGVFKPKKPVQLEEGAAVELVILRPAAETMSGNGAEVEDTRTPQEIIAAIAALPLEGKGEKFSGRDHDRILYGPKGAR